MSKQKNTISKIMAGAMAVVLSITALPFSMLFTEASGEKYVYEDSEVRVTAELTDPSGIPEDAVFRVSPVTEDSTAYSYNAYMDALDNMDDFMPSHDGSNTRLYDMGFFVSDKDEEGNPIPGTEHEVELAGGSARFNIEFNDGALLNADPENVEVKHLPISDEKMNGAVSTAAVTDADASDVEVEDVEAVVEAGTDGDVSNMSFELDSLSVVAVIYNSRHVKTGAVDVDAEFTKVSAVDSEEKVIPFVEKGANNYEIQEGYTSNDLKKISFTLKFALKTASANRKIGAGDYFDVIFPDVLTPSADLSNAKAINTKDGLTIANVQRIPESEKTNGVRFTFTSEVDANHVMENVSGYFAMVMNVDDTSFERDPVSIAVDINQDSVNELNLVIPRKTTVLDGIDKKGEVDQDNPQFIKWTVNVGKNSQGVSLRGVRFSDIMKASDIDGDPTARIRTVKSVDADGKAVYEYKDISLTRNSDASAGNVQYDYTFGDVKAPQTLVIKTRIPASVLNNTEASGLDVVNNAKFDVADSGLELATGAENTASASVNISAPAVKKQGYPISSDELLWSIVVDASKSPVYACDVIDRLSDQVSYVKNSIHIEEGRLKDGEEAGEDISSVPGASFVYKDITGSDPETLTVKFGNRIEKGTLYTITFRTKVKTDRLTYEGSGADRGATVSNGTYEVITYFPHGGGGTTPVEYGYPEVSRKVYTAFLSKRVVKTDLKTGFITWEINPSTAKEVDRFGKAEITDTIPSELTIDEGSVKVTYKGTEVPAGPAGSEAEQAMIDGNKIKIVINQPEGREENNNDLSNYKITYKTRADKYLSDNLLHEYENSAFMTLDGDRDGSVDYKTPVAKAKTVLQNSLIKKNSKVEFDSDNQPYFHFTIKINENENSMKGVILEDDIKNIIKFGKSPDTATGVLPADYYEIATEASSYQKKSYIEDSEGNTITDKTIEVDGKKASVSFGDIDESYTVHLYVAVNTKKTGFYDAVSGGGNDYDNVLYAGNKADLTFTAAATGLVQTVSASSLASESNSLDTDMLSKKGSYGEDDLDISWLININPAGSRLGDTGRDAVLTDTIPKNQALDVSTIVISKRIRNDGGDTFEKVYENKTAKSGSGIKVERVKERSGETVLTITLPDGTEEYKIQYITTLIDSSESSIKNTASLTWGEKPYSKSKEATAAATSGGSATGEAHIVMTLTKVDDFASDINQQVTLQGAMYGLFSEDQLTDLRTWSENNDTTGMKSNAIDYGWTGEDGKLRLTGLLNTNYYIVEITPPGTEGSVNSDAVGYIRDTKIYGPYKYSTSGRYNIKPVHEGKSSDFNFFTDVRDTEAYRTGKVTLNKTFTPSDADSDIRGAGNDRSGYKATYKLIMYPKSDPNLPVISKDGSKTKTMKLRPVKDESNNVIPGTYTYDISNTVSENTVDNLDTTGSGSDGASSLTITNLPWGVYELQEISTKNGYAVEKEAHLFAVKRDTCGAENATNTAIVVQNNPAAEENDLILAENRPINLRIEEKDGEDIIKDSETEFILTPDKNDECFAADKDEEETVKKQELKGSDISDYSNTWYLSGDLLNDRTYTLTEKTAPLGYEKVPNLTVHVTKDGVITVTEAGNSKKPANALVTYDEDKNIYTLTLTAEKTRFTINKTDQNGLPVSGAGMSLKGRFSPEGKAALGATDIFPNGDLLEWTTSSESLTLTGLLVAGEKYEIKETVTPDGYRKAADGKTYYIALSDDGKNVCYLGTDPAEDTARTASDISADKAAKTTGVGIEISQASSTAPKNRITVHNHRILAKIDLTKTENEIIAPASKKNIIPGASFTLTREGDDVNSIVLVSDATGHVTLDGTEIKNPWYEEKNISLGLPAGTYTITETTSASGYAIPKSGYSYTFTVKDDDTVLSPASAEDQYLWSYLWTGTVENPRLPVNFNITKKEAGTDKVLEGTEYTIYKKDGSTALTDADLQAPVDPDLSAAITNPAVTDADGKLSFNNLKWGSYVIKETKAPLGYQVDEKDYHLVIQQKGIYFGSADKGWEAKNLDKLDESVNALDDYRSAVHVFENDATGFSFYKVDQYNKPCPGATIVISGKFITEDGSKVEASVSHTYTDEEGLEKWTLPSSDAASFAEDRYRLIAGEKYTVSESIDDAHKGTYNFPDTSPEMEFSVSGNGKELSVTKGNTEHTHGSIALRVGSEDKTSLAVINDRKYAVAVALMKANSKYEKNGRNYKDDELVSGAVFRLYKEGSDSPVEFKVKKDGEDKVVTDLVAKNGLVITPVLTKNDNKTELITNTSENLLVGERYYFKEIKGAPGYRTDSVSEYHFTLGLDDADNAVVVVNGDKTSGAVECISYSGDDIKRLEQANKEHKLLDELLPACNEPIPGSITLTKEDLEAKDASNNPLKVAGAGFTLYRDEDCTDQAKDAAGSIVNEKFTDGSGVLTWDNLDWGTYYIKETTLPDGYMRDNIGAKETGSGKAEGQDYSTYNRTKACLKVTLDSKDAENADEAPAATVLFRNKQTVISIIKKTIIKITGEINGIVIDSANKASTANSLSFSIYESDLTSGAEIPVDGGNWTVDADSDEDKMTVSIPKEIRKLLTSGKTYIIRETGEDASYRELPDVRITVNNDGTVTLLDGANVATDSYKDSDGTVIAKTEKDADGNSVITITNVRIIAKGAYFTKVDAKDGTGLNGAEFNLYYDAFGTPDDEGDDIVVNREPVRSKTVGSNKGIVKTSDLVRSEYSDEYNEILTKAGISSGLSSESGQLRDTGLLKGAYYFKEVKAPKYYQLDSDKRISFVISDEDNDVDKNLNVVFENARKNGEIHLTKFERLSGSPSTISAATGKKVDGAVYTLYTEEDYNSERAGLAASKTGLNGEKGKINFLNLDWGKYYIVEQLAAPGYKMDKSDSSPYVVYVGPEASKTENTGDHDGNYEGFDYSDNAYRTSYAESSLYLGTDIYVTDEPMGLTVKKVNLQGTGLENAQFRVTRYQEGESTGETFDIPADSSGKAVGTDVNGLLVFDHDWSGIAKGYNFKLTETEAPAGYGKIDPIWFHVRDDEGNLEAGMLDGSNLPDDTLVTISGSMITIVDPKLTEFEIVKKGQDQRSVTGTEFTLSPVTPGDFSLTGDEAVNEVTGASDVRFEGGSLRFKVLNSDNDDESDRINLKGVIKNSNRTTNTSGQEVWSDIHTYVLKETLPPQYLTVAKDIYIRIDRHGKVYTSDSADGIFLGSAGGDQLIEVVDRLNEFTFRVVGDVMEKSGSGQTIYNNESGIFTAPISNVSFKLYGDRDLAQEIHDRDSNRIVSDENGQITLKGLKNGTTYYLKEVTQPEYDFEELLDNDTVYCFDIDEQGIPSDLYHFKDNDLSGTSEKIFTDDDNSDRNTIVDQVVRANVSVKKVNATDENKFLPGSTYGLYRRITDSQVRELYEEDNQTGAGAGTGSRGSFFLNMATLTVHAADASEGWVKISEKKTDANGNMSFGGLVTGVDYMIMELKAPAGYQVSEKPITFRFAVENGKAILNREKGANANYGNGTATELEEAGTGTYKTIWKEPPTVARFIKVDEKGNALAGARLHIEDENGNIVKDDSGRDIRWTSTANSGGDNYAEISGILEAGKKYYLVEDKAPAGYAIADPVAFTVTERRVASSEDDIEANAAIVSMTDEIEKEKKSDSEIGGSDGDLSDNDSVIKWVRKDGTSPKTGLFENHPVARVMIVLILLIVAAGTMFFIKNSFSIKKLWK